jgi:hypothetical protein
VVSVTDPYGRILGFLDRDVRRRTKPIKDTRTKIIFRLQNSIEHDTRADKRNSDDIYQMQYHYIVTREVRSVLDMKNTLTLSEIRTAIPDVQTTC